MKIRLSRKFAAIFIKELSQIFGKVNAQNWNDFSCMCICTYGWHDAFKQACLATGNKALYQYYDSLSWEKSDIFDGDVADALGMYIN